MGLRSPQFMSSSWFKKCFLNGETKRGKGAANQQQQQQQPAEEGGSQQPKPPPAPLQYRRPKFLRGAVCAEKLPGKRPICCPSRDRPLQWNTGYAETVNAEKSEFNEDQATCCQISLRKRQFEHGKEEDQQWLILCSTEYLTGYYWALFDGHGGSEASIMASNYLHYCIRQKLEDVIEGITEDNPPMHLSRQCICQNDPLFVEEKKIQQENVVIGALESAFQECDKMIGQEMKASNQSAGCTALVALYLQGRLYVANAGDSRVLLVRKRSIVPLSTEFTPETDRKRIQHLAFIYPKLLADEFTRFEFPRRLKGDDVGQKVLYRDYSMEGWGYKTVMKEDLKYPLIHGHGKQARLLGTLAVSRGLGDHLLKVIETNIEIKPFLSCIPKASVLSLYRSLMMADEILLKRCYNFKSMTMTWDNTRRKLNSTHVEVFDLTSENVNEDDVLIMATDGLWDVLSNEDVAQIVRNFLQNNITDPYRFSELAKLLVQKARGKEDGYYWIKDSKEPASYDDISVFAIPLYNKNEY